MKWVPGDPSNIFLVTSFTWKRPESSDFMYSSIFMLENIWHLKLREGHMHSLQLLEAKRNENRKKSEMLLFLSFLATKIWQKVQRLSIFSPLHKKCQYSELFWSLFSRIRTRTTPNTDTFYEVLICRISKSAVHRSFVQ